MRRSLPHYRHRAGIDTVCFSIPDTRRSAPPGCLHRYARLYYISGTQVIKGVRWRAHTVRGYLYVRIDAPHPAVPMDRKTLSSRISTILALLGVPRQTWSEARVKRVDVAYDSRREAVPNGMSTDQKRRKMELWEYTGKTSTTLYIGNKSRISAYYPKHVELRDVFRVVIPCPSFRREERYMKSAVKTARLHTIGRVLAHAKRESDRHRRYNNVKHLSSPCNHAFPAYSDTLPGLFLSAAPLPKERGPPLHSAVHTP